MGFKLKSGNKPPFKGMGSSPLKSVQSELTGKPTTPDIVAGGKYGTNMKDFALNSQERADEYDRRNWAHDDTSKVNKPAATPAEPVVKGNKATTTDTDPNTGEARATTTTTREDPNNPSNTIKVDTKKRKDGTISKITEEDASDMTGDTGKGDKKRVWKDQPGRKGSRNVVKSGRHTEDKSDDVKKVTKVRGGKKQTQTSRKRTADTVTTTKNDLATGETTSKSRKRLGKGLVKDVVAKAKANKANKKAVKKGRKAEEAYAAKQAESAMPKKKY